MRLALLVSRASGRARAAHRAAVALRATVRGRAPRPEARGGSITPGPGWQHVGGPFLSRAHCLTALAAYRAHDPGREYRYGTDGAGSWNVYLEALPTYGPDGTGTSSAGRGRPALRIVRPDEH
ncbi:hypothetical protein SLIV_37255 [Streptomyces lividans TK24]|uniref:Secreted protein n=1 Tax=Streptomyces lividans TK24 TaxID=457428 RepID=A0ABN4E3S3_STRLI|nr:hypothetical protein SLIV_37255 [Streptomyces lividans TK24]QSJ13945.1 hypothetical protein SLIVDG2_37255 [Streptomyces lividans]QTD74855.1 hypothetical protein SLIVYQS_37255 [Streptomyces lividans TK24] [Streptomyces lividans]